MTGTQTSNYDAGDEDWSVGQLWTDYRKVFVIGLLAGLIAFMGSFVVPATYVSGTRVLIRGRDTTVLSSTGTSLEGQPGVIDSQLATALTQTQAAMLTSRAVAEEVEARLDLSGRPQEDGPIKFAVRNLGAVYVKTRAFITHGFYREEERRERFIGRIQGGLGAEQVEDSYVLEIGALWDDREIAAEVANTAAEVLVDLSNRRFAEESAAYAQFLGEQVDDARTAEREARAAVAVYQEETGLFDIDEELRLTTQSISSLETQIEQTEANLEASRAESAELEAQLNRINSTTSARESITTGRSQTNIDSSSANPTYQTLQAEYSRSRAAVAAIEAKFTSLQNARSVAISADSGSLTAQEAQLRDLLLDRDLRTAQVSDLTQQFQEASLSANSANVEISRLDLAQPPTFPVGPKRYLYLIIGGFIGALVGFVWSFLVVKKRERDQEEAVIDATTNAQSLDLRERTVMTETTLAEARVGRTNGPRGD